MPVPDDNTKAREKLLTCGSALFIGAHPDDIEFRAGALVCLMRQHGTRVTFAIATRGGRGWPEPIGRPLERIRERQQYTAAGILGGAEVVFFDYPDGSLQAHVEPLAGDLARLIADLRPDVVLSWDPEFIDTTHPDHQAAADATLTAAAGLDVCWYGSTRPNVRIGFDEETLQMKLRAIKAHKTETPWFHFDLRLKKRMIARMRQEGSEIGCDYAEAFRLTLPRR